jgi:hypothetical protein
MKPLPCNQPKRAPPGDPHKFIVRSCSNDVEKIIRFGARGYQDYTQHKDPIRRKSFRARHKCDEVTDKNTARHWACEYLW